MQYNLHMPHSNCRVYLIIAGLVVVASGDDCPRGWFGPRCQFQCHCSRSPTCSKEGTCPLNEPCKNGFFGPGCQYVDLLQTESVQSLENYIKDNNHDTCNLDENSHYVTVTLKKPHPFTWMRLHVNNTKLMMNFTLKLNGCSPCSNERRFRYSDKIVDVICDPIFHDQVTIEGLVAPFICTVYISGGRNVALKQQATSSSVIRYNEDLTKASNAVDGNTARGISASSCMHTESIATIARPWWRLTYEKAVNIYRVRIFQRDESLQKLRHFVYEAFSGTTTVIRYIDPNTNDVAVFDFSFADKSAITSIQISLGDPGVALKNVDRHLHMCEVETYGDLVCNENKYNLLCEGNCSCNVAQTCSHITGTCDLGCPVGFYGTDCASRCSANCVSNICGVKTGECLGCKPGYTGRTCNTECTPGFYGDQCAYLCSENCFQSCSSKTGYCMCKERYIGKNCTECLAGFFGTNCTEPCSSLCNICEYATGSCLLCTGNYKGSNCSYCTSKFFGDECEKLCPPNCLNDTCYKDSGKCLACKRDYFGDYCQEVGIHDFASWNYLLLIPASFIFILICVCLCVWYCLIDRSKEEPESGIQE